MTKTKPLSKADIETIWQCPYCDKLLHSKKEEVIEKERLTELLREFVEEITDCGPYLHINEDRVWEGQEVVKLLKKYFGKLEGVFD